MDAGTAIRKLVGGLLLAAGSIIALSCGLCTGYFGITGFFLLFSHDGANALSFTGPFLLAGAVATGVGTGLAWLGIRMLRDAAPPSPDR